MENKTFTEKVKEARTGMPGRAKFSGLIGLALGGGHATGFNEAVLEELTKKHDKEPTQHEYKYTKADKLSFYYVRDLHANRHTQADLVEELDSQGVATPSYYDNGDDTLPGRNTNDQNSGANDNPETLDGDPPFSIVNGTLVANGDKEDEKALVSNFNNIQDSNLRTTTLGYIGEVLADTNLSDLRKRVIVGAFMNTALGNDNVAYRNENANIDPKYRANLTKIEEMAGGDGEIGIDADPFADFDVASDDLERSEEELERSEEELERSEEELERSEKALAEAKERLQRSIENLENTNEDWNETRNKLIQNAKAIMNAGGNPADVPGWEKAMEDFNITPDDL